MRKGTDFRSLSQWAAQVDPVRLPNGAECADWSGTLCGKARTPSASDGGAVRPRSIGRHERVHLRVRRPLKPADLPLDAPSRLAVRRSDVNADTDGASVPDGDLHRH